MLVEEFDVTVEQITKGSTVDFKTSPRDNKNVKIVELFYNMGSCGAKRYMSISVCSNANPLHYYALRVPRKADRRR